MSFKCSSLSIIKAQVLIFLQLKDISRILRFSSVPTSFIVTTFWGVGGLDVQKKNGSELCCLSYLLSFSVDISYHGGLVVV